MTPGGDAAADRGAGAGREAAEEAEVRMKKTPEGIRCGNVYGGMLCKGFMELVLEHFCIFSRQGHGWAKPEVPGSPPD